MRDSVGSWESQRVEEEDRWRSVSTAVTRERERAVWKAGREFSGYGCWGWEEVGDRGRVVKPRWEIMSLYRGLSGGG